MFIIFYKGDFTMNMNAMNRRRFIGALSATAAGVAVSAHLPTYGMTTENKQVSDARQEKEPLRIAVFDIDATPPVGTLLAYDPMIRSYDLGLRAKGIVLTGAGQPIVLCAIDWGCISNEGHDAFRQTLAEAAHTMPERVAVHVLHQHDAPICDFTAEKMLRDAGMNPGHCEGSFARQLLPRLGKAVEESMKKLQPVTHVGTGQAPVFEVASNRRILGSNGKVEAMRYTACADATLRAKPEGVIDPELTLLSFWNRESPVAVMTFYATHPQSYYRTGVPNPDFPGIARFFRQLAVPDALHVHFNGAGGNIGAGKYNDGSHENRLALAKRLADGMEKAWENVKKVPLMPEDVNWENIPVILPTVYDDVDMEWKPEGMYSSFALTRFAWAKRQREGNPIRIGCLRLGSTRTLFMPGELFVEYQLAAKAIRKDLTVSVAAYGDCGPEYIGTKEAYTQGGYEPSASAVTSDAEEILMDAVRKLLK
ncbi:MAG: hypothetical protein LBP87_06165 [Planctomycetaceae bacterium]|nr:hypothetical protein [Planctomycetaceae bacterium]